MIAFYSFQAEAQLLYQLVRLVQVPVPSSVCSCMYFNVLLPRSLPLTLSAQRVLGHTDEHQIPRTSRIYQGMEEGDSIKGGSDRKKTVIIEI